MAIKLSIAANGINKIVAFKLLLIIKYFVSKVNFIIEAQKHAIIAIQTVLVAQGEKTLSAFFALRTDYFNQDLVLNAKTQLD